MQNRILLLGASGSGTSTIGKILCNKLKIVHVDLDDLFWYKTDPPFTKFRSKKDLKDLVENRILKLNEWIISGDPGEWDAGIENHLTGVILLMCSTEERVRRLNQREAERHGKELLEGGKMFEIHRNFIEWTKQYEVGGIAGRTLMKQKSWMKNLECEKQIINSEDTIEKVTSEIMRNINL